MSAIPMPRPTDRRQAQIMRGRDTENGRPLWTIDEIIRDPRDGSSQHVVIAEATDMRGILAQASALEKRGFYVLRSGLAR